VALEVGRVVASMFLFPPCPLRRGTRWDGVGAGQIGSDTSQLYAGNSAIAYGAYDVLEPPNPMIRPLRDPEGDVPALF
jgi:hypothetical protein